ncbi:MAG: DUF6036 family nucleotidyltransferase [Chloroflexota bacterium]
MNRDQLAHVLRAAANATGQIDILVIGSQAILGSFDADELPIEATRSIEADIGFLHDPSEELSDQIDGSIGEMSPFYDAFGYYGQGISVRTAVLPNGWRERLVKFESEATRPARGWCLEPHDLVIAKLVRGDPKDYEFAVALRSIAVVDSLILAERLDATEVSGPVRSRIQRWITSGQIG